MELRRLKPEYKVVGMICDMCHENCRDMCSAKNEIPGNGCDDPPYEHGTLSASWGYWSDNRDLTDEECHLCEKCFTKVREFIIGQGGTVREIHAQIYCNSPNHHRKKGVDYDLVPGMSIWYGMRNDIDLALKEIDRQKLASMEQSRQERELIEREQHLNKARDEMEARIEAYKIVRRQEAFQELNCDEFFDGFCDT